ncbi:OLC1v1015267C3 [Oldenlandia corymbosa var. corymbosa]|uniref:OLC1v1015267C3 n=1 Tax=Oldenlandia corymbosa var. corymbosa TaxID=529605 RepID=A0AAV1E6C5_OLDCO|nr:OLC1v1015267C3 [Oldenlandia corymbosa var. corymbosa]
MNRVKLVVFPIKGRNWVFSSSRSIDTSQSSSSQIPSTLKDLWKKMTVSKHDSVNHSSPHSSNVELLVDFTAHKMNGAWNKLGNAPEGSFKSKIHGLGLKLLSRVKPSEIFLKSIPKDATLAEITYPSGLNPRLVRRRIRHVASRGAILHKKYFYASVTLLPLTSLLAVLPMPNIPFFWILYRSYSNWRALRGSEKLLQLVSDSSVHQESSSSSPSKGNGSQQNSGKQDSKSLGSSLLVGVSII